MPDAPEAVDDEGTASEEAGSGDAFAAIARMARDFCAPRALLTAVELDLFTCLGARRLTATELAAATDADERGIELLANALVAIGLLSVRQGRYAATPPARRYLDRGSPDYRGKVIELARWWWSRMSDLTDVVRSGVSVDGPPDSIIEDFTWAMHQGKPDAGERLAAALDLHGVTRALDLGCGAATFAEALARAVPDLHVVCVDRPEVLEAARRRLPPELLDGRLSLVARDFLAEGIPLDPDRPGAYHLAVVSSIVHLLAPEQNVDLFQRLHDALEPGGQVAVRDFIVDDSGTEPPEAALFTLLMLVSTRSGRCYSFEHVREWLHDAGFGEVEMSAFDGEVQLITARRA